MEPQLEIMCPSCGNIALVPESAQGATGKCSSCGGTVHVPYLKQKVCCVCGIDVSREKRTRDASGKYYCLLCFREKFQPPPSNLPANVPCSVCRRVFPREKMLSNGGHPTCRECFGEVVFQREQQREAAMAEADAPDAACSICQQVFDKAEMLVSNAKPMCRSCYVQLFTAGDDGMSNETAPAHQAKSETGVFWKKIKGAFHAIPRKCPKCGRLHTTPAGDDGNFLLCRSCQHRWEQGL